MVEGCFCWLPEAVGYRMCHLTAGRIYFYTQSEVCVCLFIRLKNGRHTVYLLIFLMHSHRCCRETLFFSCCHLLLCVARI